MARGANVGFGFAENVAQAGIRKAHRLKVCKVARIARQAIAPDIVFAGHDLRDLAQEPKIDTGQGVNVFDREAHAEGLRHDAQPIRGLFAERLAQGPRAAKLNLVKAVQACLERAQCLLHAFLEISTNRHGFADRFHRGGEKRFGAFKLLKCEARNLGHDIINGRLE